MCGGLSQVSRTTEEKHLITNNETQVSLLRSPTLVDDKEFSLGKGLGEGNIPSFMKIGRDPCSDPLAGMTSIVVCCLH